MIFDVTVNDRDYRVELHRNEDGGNANWTCRVNGDTVEVNAAATANGVLSLLIGGLSYEVVEAPGQQQLALSGQRYTIEVRDLRSLRSRRSRTATLEGPKKVVAPMPGKVVRVIAPEGTEVEQGAGVIVIEAMKMQNELKSPKKGKVAKIAVAEGAAVNPGDVLAIIE
jgi:biotin carboxyl carrier protein